MNEEIEEGTVCEIAWRLTAYRKCNTTIADSLKDKLVT